MCFWCERVYSWLSRELWEPVRRWFIDTVRRCDRQPCNWWCLCCNKWFCWLVVLIATIIVFIVYIIIITIVTVVCGVCFIVCFVLCIFFWISRQTPMENCLNWCQRAQLDPWEVNDPTDPQEPLSEDIPFPPVGPSGQGVSNDDKNPK